MEYKYSSGGSSYRFTAAMESYVEERFNKLAKYLSDEPIKITLDKDGDVFILKCQVVTKSNKRLRTEFRGPDYYILVTESRDALEKQIRKRKEKSYWKERIKRGRTETSESDYGPTIFARTKKFVLDPITSEKALDEMNSLGHDWYAFRDVDNNDAISVVYRRFDNTYGLVTLD